MQNSEATCHCWRKLRNSIDGKNPCSRIGRLQLATIPWLIYRPNATSTKIPGSVSAKTDELILKVCGNSRDPGQPKPPWQTTTLENPHFPISKLPTRSGNQDSVVLAKGWGIKLRIQKQTLTYMTYSFSTRFTGQSNGGDNRHFGQCCWDTWISTPRKMNLYSFLTPYTIVKLKMGPLPKK